MEPSLGLGMITALAPPIRTNIWWGCLKRVWMACDFLRIDSIFSILVIDGTLGDSSRRVSEETTIQLYGVCDIRVGLASLLMAIEHLSVIYLGVVVMAFAAFSTLIEKMHSCRLNRSSLRRSTRRFISCWLSKQLC